MAVSFTVTLAMITRFTGRGKDPSCIAARNASATSGMGHHSGMAGFVRYVIVWLIGRPACGAPFTQDWLLHDGHVPYILCLLSLLSTFLCFFPVTIRSPIVWAEETQWWYLGRGCLPGALEGWRCEIMEAGPPFV